MPYQVTIGGESWRTDELTLDEAEQIETETGRGWIEINPFRSATDCKAIMVAFLSRAVDRDVAATKIGAMSLRDVLDSFERVDDDRPTTYEDGLPKAEDGPSTDGSNNSPTSSDGPPP